MILMRGTDPWGRGYPPGLRTQGRGFDSRWVRFNQAENMHPARALFSIFMHYQGNFECAGKDPCCTTRVWFAGGFIAIGPER
jgi:hypothetical protein